MTRRREDQGTMKTFRATALEVRDGRFIADWLLPATDLDDARERAREQAARRGFAGDVFVRVEPVEDREAGTVYRATVTDTISREEIGRFSFSADSVEAARQRAWSIAASGFGTPEGTWVVGGTDIDVRVERASK